MWTGPGPGSDDEAKSNLERPEPTLTYTNILHYFWHSNNWKSWQCSAFFAVILLVSLFNIQPNIIECYTHTHRYVSQLLTELGFSFQSAYPNKSHDNR